LTFSVFSKLLEVDILEVDILEVDILEVDILEVDILKVYILEVYILEVGILEVDIFDFDFFDFDIFDFDNLEVEPLPRDAGLLAPVVDRGHAEEGGAVLVAHDVDRGPVESRRLRMLSTNCAQGSMLFLTIYGEKNWRFSQKPML
jgi:hypothetical protein